MNTEKITTLVQALSYQDQENNTDLTSEVIFAIQRSREYFEDENPSKEKLLEYISDELQSLEMINPLYNEVHIEVIKEVIKEVPALLVITMFSK